MRYTRRRLAPTLVTAIATAVLALPSIAAAVEQPAVSPTESARQALLTATTDRADAQQRLDEARDRLESVDVVIARVEAETPRDTGETLIHALKVTLAPFSEDFRDDAAQASAAEERLAVLYAERERAASALAEAEVAVPLAADAIAQAKRALADAERGDAERAAIARAAAIAEFGRFPVAGPCEFIDSWGFARSGGRRHQGTDIMAAAGTPVVAVKAGIVVYRTSSLGGRTLYLTTDDGTEYYYAHLQTATVTSGRVEAGQQIGTVGSTGNASASAPHLHFEVHLPRTVNPYPYLLGMVL